MDQPKNTNTFSIVIVISLSNKNYHLIGVARSCQNLHIDTYIHKQLIERDLQANTILHTHIIYWR